VYTVTITYSRHTITNQVSHRGELEITAATASFSNINQFSRQALSRQVPSVGRWLLAKLFRQIQADQIRTALSQRAHTVKADVGTTLQVQGLQSAAVRGQSY
jgi:hypothetical protein